MPKHGPRTSGTRPGGLARKHAIGGAMLGHRPAPGALWEGSVAPSDFRLHFVQIGLP